MAVIKRPVEKPSRAIADQVAEANTQAVPTKAAIILDAATRSFRTTAELIRRAATTRSGMRYGWTNLPATALPACHRRMRPPRPFAAKRQALAVILA